MQAEARVEERPDDAVPPVPLATATIPVGRWAMAAALLVLNLCDVVTTKLILGVGGSEANPVMAPIVGHPCAAYALKLSMALAVGFLLLKAPRTSRLADRAVMATIVAYTAVICWNVGLLITAARAGHAVF
jgi:hypothetical protein